MIAIKNHTQIGYHRVSDDSVTSFAVPDSGKDAVLTGLMANWDVDLIWTRDKQMDVNWVHNKNAIKE